MNLADPGLLLGVAAASPYLLAPLAALIYGRPGPNIRDWEPLARGAAPPVSVIVPARNEAPRIERCVRSLLASSYPDFQVIVVDDRSQDATAKIVERIAAHDHRLTLVRGAELPKGWCGKPWACWQGYQQAHGKVLLFTDADTAHGSTLLGHAVAALETERADMLTLMPLQEMKGFWERVVQPFFYLGFMIILVLRFGTLSRMSRNRSPRSAIANGQFILTTRDAYEFVGGHRRVQHTVVEDLMLAREYVATGRRIQFAMAQEDMRTRMYSSLGEIVQGWSKNVFVGLLETTHSMALALVAAAFLLLLPASYLLPTAALTAGLLLDQGALVGFGAVSYVGASLMVAHALRSQREPDFFGLFHPLGALVQGYIMLRAAARGRKRIEWKGRTYVQG